VTPGMTEAIQQVINALSLGSIYALIALGVALVFSILRLINFAHGELVTVAGYAMFLLAGLGVPWFVIAPAAILAAVAAALLLERIAYRPLRGAQPLTLLLTSYGISLVLQSAFLLSFGARPKGIEFPAWVDAGIVIGTLRIQWLDVATLLVTLAVFGGLNLFLRRTVIGLALRSAADDFRTTRLMGIRANAVVIGAFVVSGALAGLAALFFFAAIPTVTPSTGFGPMLHGFIATVIGGLGSLTGAVLGAFLLAGLNVFCEAVLSDSLNPYVDAIVFVLAIAVLRFRPSGVLGLRRAEEVRV
jgi:branched-chain amino acid transport system permease protein